MIVAVFTVIEAAGPAVVPIQIVTVPAQVDAV